MRPFLEGGVGNPNAPHSLGLEARASLDGSRAKVARLFAATPAGVIFTGSATEANNLAIKGVAQRAAGRHLVTSAIEHISVIDSCRDLEKRGWTVTYLGVDADGRVDNLRKGASAPRRRWSRRPPTVRSAPSAGSTGIGRSRGPAALFHVDAVGAGRFRSRRRLPHRSALSSNDLYGLPGLPCGCQLAPQILGGGRSRATAGTENLPASSAWASRPISRVSRSPARRRGSAGCAIGCWRGSSTRFPRRA
jgi:cysteine desulfurase